MNEHLQNKCINQHDQISKHTTHAIHSLRMAIKFVIDLQFSFLITIFFWRTRKTAYNRQSSYKQLYCTYHVHSEIHLTVFLSPLKENTPLIKPLQPVAKSEGVHCSVMQHNLKKRPLRVKQFSTKTISSCHLYTNAFIVQLFQWISFNIKLKN